MIFCKRDRQSGWLLSYDIEQENYYWGKTIKVYSWLCTESKLLLVVLMDRYWKKKTFSRSRSAFYVSGNVLIFSSKDTTSCTAAIIGVTTWLNFPWPTVVLHDPSIFCTGQIKELKGNVMGIPYLFQVLNGGTNFCSSSINVVLFLIHYFLRQRQF